MVQQIVMDDIVLFKVNDGEECFLKKNKRVVEWTPITAVGLVFTNRCLETGETIHVVISGSGSIEVGIVFKAPSLLTSLQEALRNDIHFLFQKTLDAEEYTVIVHVERGFFRNRITWFHAGYRHSVNVCFGKRAWLVWNINYGHIETRIGKDNGKEILFEQTVTGSNIQFQNNVKNMVKLKSLIPCIYAFLSHSLTNGNIVNIRIKPVKTITNRILYQPKVVIGYLLPEEAETDSNEVHKIKIGNEKRQRAWKHSHILTGALCYGIIKIELKENSFILFLNTNERVYFKEIETQHANRGLDIVFQCFGVKLEMLEPFSQIGSGQAESFLSSMDSSGYVKAEFLHGAVRKSKPNTTFDDQQENYYENVDINGPLRYNQDFYASLDSMGYIRLDKVRPDQEDSIKKLYEPIWPSLQRELRLLQCIEIPESDYNEDHIEITLVETKPSAEK